MVSSLKKGECTRECQHLNCMRNQVLIIFRGHSFYCMISLHFYYCANLCSFVSPIELSDEPLPIGNPVIATGWGRIASNSSQMSDTLQQVQMPVVDMEKCNTQFENVTISWNETLEHSFCAGYSGESYTNVCHGDLGGPAAYRSSWRHPWKLYGVAVGVSGGCSSDAKYAVFVDVSSIYSWVYEKIDGYSCVEP